MSSESPTELTDAQLEKIAAELREIATGSSWSRTLATGELVLKSFFGGNVDEWRTHRRHKEASIRRLAQRPDCPLGKSALSEAVAIYVARKDLPDFVDDLSPSHVALALRLPVLQRVELLRRALAGGWSVRELRVEVLALKRRAGERRGRPRFSQARAALSQAKRSLECMATTFEILSVTQEIDRDTLETFERTLEDFAAKLADVSEHLSALAQSTGRPGLKSAVKASLVVTKEPKSLAG